MQQPFVWGAGGKRMTPEQIEAQRRIAASLSKPDFSPIASPWQGLARVAGNVAGALDNRRLDKAQAQNTAENSSVVQALLAPDATPDAFATAALNPSLDPTTRKFAMGRYEAMTKPADTPKEYEIDAVIRNAGIAPGTPEYAKAYQDYLRSKTDPFSVMNLPGGAAYVGPRSGIGGAVGAGGSAQPPATLPPDFDFGGPTQPASGTFR